MQLSNSLILFSYILRQFGFKSFTELRDAFSTKLNGYDSSGRSYFASALLATPKPVADSILLQYDEVIRGYEQALIRHRSEPFLSLKYYQYFTILFSEYFLDELSNRPRALLQALNHHKTIDAAFAKLPDYTPDDLKKLALWMATGSGKTLLMHINYRQMLKYFKHWENIMLITPNEGLSRQHYDEFKKSGIKAKLYSGSEESLKTTDGEVLIIEITKLTKDKESEGVSVDVDYFSESRNLVFIDEGHKGQKSEEQAWKKLREHLTRGEQSFTFEYSATFGQIMGNNKDLLDEYSRAILFDYSYRHFYADGYGKDFSVFNIESQTDDYSPREVRLLMVGSLLGFYEQLALFEQNEQALKQYNIEKPLWVFVGSKVIGKKSSLTQQDKQNLSDVVMVLHFFKEIISAPEALQADMDAILNEHSGLLRAGDDIFRNRFGFLKDHRPTAETVLRKVFHGAGSLQAFQIKNADGEIGLQTTTGQQFFGVINIGDVNSFSKKLEEDTHGEIAMQDDSFSPSLFRAISDRHSPVNILIGSKKFIEGWNSWRVSSMGLMNMGQGEGAQIIQLFGRGVRLKGREFSLKREEQTAPYFVKALQTISIFGLNARYMSNFLTNIEKEVENSVEFTLDIQLNHKEDWEHKIFTFKSNGAAAFRSKSLALSCEPKILKRIQIDLRPKVALATGGFNNAMADGGLDPENPLHKFASFMDWDSLLLSCHQYRQIRNFPNLLMDIPTLKAIIGSQQYVVKVADGQFRLQEALNGRIQRLAESLLKDYISKFYSDKEKDYLTKNLEFDYLSEEKYPEVFPDSRRVIIKVPESKRVDISKLFEDITKFYTHPVVNDIPTLHFDRHLYSPLVAYRKGKEDIKSVPVKMNEGETKFLTHLRSFFIGNAHRFSGKEIFILRNLSKRGIGFFVESASFYPDFIIWIIEGKKQTIYFVDPKGILMLGNFKNEKIIFCNETIREINTSIQQQIKDKGLDIEIELKAYILSVTEYEKVKATWESSITSRAEFSEHHVLFIEENIGYLIEMLG
jgi:hypothetical protein